VRNPITNKLHVQSLQFFLLASVARAFKYNRATRNMPTRAAAAREAAFLASSTDPTKQQLSSPPTTPHLAKSKLGKASNFAKKPAARRGQKLKTINVENVTLEDAPGAVSADGDADIVDAALRTPAANYRKRKRATTTKKTNGKVNREPVRGDWDELPHNMGRVGGDTTTPQTEYLATQRAISPPSKRTRRSSTKLVKVECDSYKTEEETANVLATSESKNLLITRTLRGTGNGAQQSTADFTNHFEDGSIVREVKQEHSQEFKEQDKRISPAKTKGVRASFIKTENDDEVGVKPKRTRGSMPNKIDKSNDVQVMVDEIIDATKTTNQKSKRVKKNPYGLTPGETPYPDFPMPTVEACHDVSRLLSELHGEVIAPKEIPAPSLQVTGCGEVPAVLDALIRTRLSAATTNKNAGYAFEGLVKKYGIATEGIGMGSISWSKVRQSSEDDIADAIKRGGLAKVKAKSIKTILDMVHSQNIARRDAFVQERESGTKADVLGSEHQTQGQKDLEIAVADQGILSLCYMRNLNSEEAMTELTKFPGIGVKTASCVILFCFQRPSFAVDTHVWRLCKWLKWVPENATRDQTFSHCEVRIPDELKYGLHQLFIKHGKTCGRCRAITGESSDVWADANCPIEKLVERTGKRKGGLVSKIPKKKTVAKSINKRGKDTKMDEWDSGIEDDESEEIEEPVLDDDDDQDGESEGDEVTDEDYDE
jgi:endonuclease III